MYHKDMKRLRITQFGNPLLREQSKIVPADKILTPQVQDLISSMRILLKDKKLGIGLAGPQVGSSLNLAVIELRRTPLHPEIDMLSLVIINPKITKIFGRKYQMWEGCISSGTGKAGLYAKVPRYKKIELEYLDENAVKQSKVFSDLAAHVIQHEVDHLNGILFVDKVKDSKTFMSYSEYKKMRRATVS